MDSNRESEDDDTYEMNEKETSERLIEKQLDDFRAKWKKEIHQRTIHGHSINEKSIDEQEEERIDTEEQAKQFFQRASDLEREGKLYDAIKYYRAAMQLVPDIEFRMARKLQQQPLTTMEFNNPQETILERIQMNETPDDSVDLSDALQSMNTNDTEVSIICTKNFPQQATHISCLPIEVLNYIFRWVVSSDLDVRSLEQCSRVCRGFYRCARDPQLWKMICFKTWGVNTGNPSAHINWRYMFINRPHVLFNGVYISRAAYIRQGEQSLDTFYSPWHLVEYYRYIRFFPDGVALLYTSADEPRVTVSRLKSRHSTRDPSFIYGNYRFQHNRIVIMAKRLGQRAPILTNTQRRTGRDLPVSDIEQTMHMEFEMNDVGKRKHHQLTWTHYEIKFYNKRTDEERSTILDGNDRHAYPNLIFSRVKSYTLAAESPLK